MGRQPLLNLRVDDDTKARWQAAADEAGVKLSEFIRAACEAAIAGPASGEPGYARAATSEAQHGKTAVLAARHGGKVFRGPDPKPEKKK